MPANESTESSLRAENAGLRARLEEAEQMLHAIRSGGVDALVVEGDAGLQLFTLQGHDAEQSRLRGEMLAQVIDAVVVTDIEDRITFLNAAAERQYGVRAGDVLGRQMAEVFTQSWAGADGEAAMRTALRERGEWRGELIHRTHDGRYLHVEKAVSTLRGPDGDRTGQVAAIRDVTSRIKIEQEKAEALRLLDTLLTRAPVGFLFLDRELRFVRINERLAEMNGHSVAAHLGRTVAEILPKLEATLREVTARILATGQPVLDHEFTGETAREPGVTRYWNESWYPVRNERGEIIGFGAVVEEITQRKEAEAALRLSNQRFELVVRCSQVVMFQQDLELRYTWLRNAASAFVNTATVGKRDAELMERAADSAVTEALKREVIRSGVSQRQEVLIHIQGVARHFDLLVEPLRDAAGLITGITGAAIDITERNASEKAMHESEQQYRALAAASSEIVYRMSADWSTMLPLHGRHLVPSSDQPLADWAWLDQNVPLDEHPRVRQEISDAIARKTLFELEHRVRRPDGSDGWTLSRAVPIFDENEGVIAWFGTAGDITRRKHAEEALRDNAVLLADFDHRKDAFLATLSHELRNPLGVIGNSLHLMRSLGLAGDALQQGCARMQRQVVLMKRLIDDLMDISRINQDKLMLQTELLDLAAVAQSAIENSRTVLDQRGHSVTVVLPPQPIKVDGDATRLAQVVSNLLTNASKYSDPGSPIALTVERLGDVAAVAVRDRGIGIAPADLRRVFEMFAQVNSAANLAQGGLGIGLNLVKRVVELHGGSVEARSDGLGQGSEFLVQLPLASAGSLGARSRQATTPEVTPHI